MLYHGNNVIRDSLSICEYINEITPDAGLLPQDKDLRALARSACAEMHSSFVTLRSECGMDMKRNEFKELSQKAKDDVKDMVLLQK